jgi:hypothetical protein
MGLMEKINLFSIPVYKTRIDPKLYNKQELYDIIEENYNKSPFRKSFDPDYPLSSFHTYHANFHNDAFKNLNFEHLTPLLDEKIKSFIQLLNTKREFVYEWHIVNVNVGKDGWMDRHRHDDGNNMYVFTHYLSFDKFNHPKTDFHNESIIPHITKRHKELLTNDNENSIHYDCFSFGTEEDDMFIFPSYLTHGVFPTYRDSNKLRILVVGNIHIT